MQTIEEKVDFDGFSVIRFLKDGRYAGDNVYAEDNAGNILWHLNDILHIPCPPGFTGIEKIDDRTLKVWSFVDIVYTIDVHEKKELSKVYLR